jgi:Fur family transcriptional regulator, ferric uptake regulator
MKELTDSGLKVTKNRIAILQEIKKQTKPFTIPELQDKLSSKKIDQVTLYRSVNSFLKAGLLKELRLQKGNSSYEYNHGDHHHHIVCTVCGSIESIDICVADSVARKLLSQKTSFVAITDHHFELFGVCRACA